MSRRGRPPRSPPAPQPHLPPMASRGDRRRPRVNVIAKTLPVLLLGPIGGVYTDRWDRRRTMLTWTPPAPGLVCGLAVFLVAGVGLPVAVQLGVSYVVITR
jgi:hypothetical protein